MDKSSGTVKQLLPPESLFDVSIQDPKARIQKYLDAFKADGMPVVGYIPQRARIYPLLLSCGFCIFAFCVLQAINSEVSRN